MVELSVPGGVLLQYDSEAHDTALSVLGVGTVPVSGPLELSAGKQLFGQPGAQPQDSLPVEDSTEADDVETLLVSLLKPISKPADPRVQVRPLEACELSTSCSRTRAELAAFGAFAQAVPADTLDSVTRGHSSEMIKVAV